ncbi:hypothetical protein BSKO_10160 [Bryopsis sp. KO-2023]|nr:hypothetical protein BSKO_10160 [Bryopsis sp. KO-2023]
MLKRRNQNVVISPRLSVPPVVLTKVKRATSCSSYFFCCPPDVVTPEDASIIEGIQRMRSLESPDRQKEGLVMLLRSHQEWQKKSDNMRDWAEEWIHSNALYALAGIACRLNARVDATRLKLVCVATFSLLHPLPPGSYHFNSLLERLWHAIRDKGEGSLAVYHLLLTILDIPAVRQTAIQSGFANLVHARYWTDAPPSIDENDDNKKSNSGLPTLDEFQQEDDEIIDDLFSHSPEPGDQGGIPAKVSKLESMDGHSGQYESVVPRLNLSWLRGRRTNIQPILSARAEDEKVLNWKDVSGSWQNLAPQPFPQTDPTQTLESGPRSMYEQEALTGASPAPSISNFDVGKENSPEENASFRISRGEDLLPDIGFDLNSGPKNTEKNYPCGDPRAAWNLPENNILAKGKRASDREKCAIMEVLLVLSPLSNPGMSGLSRNPVDLVLDELRRLVDGRDKDSARGGTCIDPMVLKFGFAMVHEYASQPVEFRGVSGCSSLTEIATRKSEKEDEVIQLVKEWLAAVTAVRRPGNTIFCTISTYLDILESYIDSSNSIEPSISLLTLLDDTLCQIEAQFNRAGRAQFWSKPMFKAFAGLMSLYSKILEKAGGAEASRSILTRWCNDDDLLTLLEGCGDRLIGGRWVEVGGDEQLEWALALWNFFRSVSAALVERTAGSSQGSSAGWNLGMGPNVGSCLANWDFLLKPHDGLVSRALSMDIGKHSSDGIDRCQHAQVLLFLEKAMLVPGNPFLEDTSISGFYIQLHISRFMEAYEMGGDILEDNFLCSLHLQVVRSMMRQSHPHILDQLRRHSFPEYLIRQVQGEVRLGTFNNQKDSPRDAWSRPTDPLLDKPRPPSLSPEIEEFDSFVREEDDCGPASSCDADMTVEELEKVVRNEGNVSSLVRPIEDPERAESLSVPSEDDGDNARVRIPLLPLGLSNGVDVVASVSEIPHRELTFRDSAGHDSGESWPAGLAITGDLEEDLSRWEEAERQMSRAENANSQTCSTQDSDSDSDDGIPLPSVRNRPLYVPPLALGQIGGNGLVLPGKHSQGADSKDSSDARNAETPIVPTLSFTNLCRPENDLSVHPKDTHNIGGSLPNHLLLLDDAVHLTIIEVLFEFLLLVESVQGSPRDRQDKLAVISDLSAALFHHLNHEKFEVLVDDLKLRIISRGPEAIILSRLFLRSEFDSGLYRTSSKVHHGERAQVYRCDVMVEGEGCPSTCIVKSVDFPTDHALHVCILDILSEVSVLCSLKNEVHISHLYDYGATQDSVWMVMKDYRCSLWEWRKRLPASCPWAARILLIIFREILVEVMKLHSRSIIHFDLKCNNILLEHLPEVGEDEFWLPETERLGFRVVLADFGEARSYSGKETPATVRSRGTEYFQSPEMLNMNTMKPSDFDRRRSKGAGPPSDVWGLGCLLFELITGTVLQYDTEWMRFYARVTHESMPVIEEGKARLIHEDCRSAIVGLLEFILVRDQEWRPSVSAIIDQVNALLKEDSTLPNYSPPGADIITVPTNHGKANQGGEEKVDTQGQGQDKVNLASLPEFPGGLSALTDSIHFFVGADLSDISINKHIASNRIAMVVVSQGGASGDISNIVERGSLVGLCSRMGVGGFVVEWGGEFDQEAKGKLASVLAPLKKEGKGVLVLGNNSPQQILIQALAGILEIAEGLSNFESILAIRRCMGECRYC